MMITVATIIKDGGNAVTFQICSFFENKSKKSTLVGCIPFLSRCTLCVILALRQTASFMRGRSNQDSNFIVQAIFSIFDMICLGFENREGKSAVALGMSSIDRSCMTRCYPCKRDLPKLERTKRVRAQKCCHWSSCTRGAGTHLL